MPRLRLVRDQRIVTLNQTSQRRIADGVKALLASCSVDSTQYVGPSVVDWEKSNSQSFLELRYATPIVIVIELLDQKSVTVTEILLPLPEHRWPDHILVRHGDVSTFYTKYGPKQLKTLVCMSELQLRNIEPYHDLCKTPL